MPSSRLQHTRAVLGILFAATIWGASFAAMKFAIQAHLSVGLMLSMRFSIGAVCLGGLVAVRREPIRKVAVLDGLRLGLLITVIFWLQADGLRFTSTAKSGFITGLYVLFTPVVSVLLGHRLKLAHAAGAGGGWNRGDSETLACSVLCGLQIVLSASYARRSSGWVLALTQIAVAAVLSLFITACLPAPYGFQGAARALAHLDVWISLAYLGAMATALAFFLMMTQQAHLGATEAAVLYVLEPVSAALLAMSGWVPGIREHLSPLQLTGGAIIVTAMVLAELGPRLWRPTVSGTGNSPADPSAEPMPG
jgi:drug/metabolite transporter (DMT)-like permease